MTVFLIVVNIAVLLLIAGSLYYLQKKGFFFQKSVYSLGRRYHLGTYSTVYL